jgi:CO dehydrogenase nickel-insertion accessory protein CooC1
MTKSNGNGSGRTAIHIALQGKGGVGKSLISAILSQYLASKGQDVCGIDVDPVNQTFSEYEGLRVECLNLLREGSIDQREFDLLMERFLREVGGTTSWKTMPSIICDRKGSECSSIR